MVTKLGKLEADCKNSWEALDKIIVSDPNANSKNKSIC